MRNLAFILVALTFSCGYQTEEADLIVHNAKIYTVDEEFSIQEAMAIKDGKILEVGAERTILNKFNAPVVYDAKTQPIYPGFIDAHCHFFGLGKSLQTVNLVGTSSYDEVIERIVKFAETASGEWILGRGWDQNDWEVKEFPTRKELDEMFPDRPVFVKRVDGHAAIANQKALDLAGIDATATIEGGRIELTESGELSGILVDNALELVDKVIPELTDEQVMEALSLAQDACFGVGLTTVDDAGLPVDVLNVIEQMHADSSLKMRMYVMMNPDEATQEMIKKGPILKDRLTARSVKLYADGALGSRGAALKKDYSDDPGNRGLFINNQEFFETWAGLCKENGFQLNTHCIGDSANNRLLRLYGDALGGSNDLRWRIEHAQVVSKEDMDFFSQFNILPSVQSTHCTSDMYWAGDRLGEERVKGAYAYKDLLNQNGLLALGTDFPVEDIDPLKTFFAAVFRKDSKGWPEGGWQVENALTREQALMGMTIWAAISNFEEDNKGSLVAGKVADFVVLNRDIMEVAEEDFFSTSVMATFIGGERVFEQ